MAEQVKANGYQDRASTVVPILLFMALVLLLGLWVPPPLESRNFNDMSFTPQFIPAIPTPLFAAAPMVPAT